MYPSTLVSLLMSKSGLIFAYILLNFKQRKYDIAFLASQNLYLQKQFFLSIYKQETEMQNSKITWSTTQYGLIRDL